MKHFFLRQYEKYILSEYKNKDYLFFWLSILINTTVLFFRRFDAFLNPQFWAEDGTLFFSDGYKMGIYAILKPYVGYFHTYPRLVAHFANEFVPIEYAPHLYNLSALLAVYITSAYLFIKLELPPVAKFFMCLSITLLNNGSEIYMNLTNAQWVLALNLIIFIGSRNYLSGYFFVLESLFILIISLTGPFSVLLTPFFAVRLIQIVRIKGKLWYLLLYLGIFLCIFLQTTALKDHVDSASTIRPNLTFDNFLHLTYSSYITVLGISELNFLRNAHLVYISGGLFILVALFYYSLYVLFSSDPDLDFVWICILSSALFTYVLLARMDYQEFRDQWMARYFYLPPLLLTWSSIGFFLKRPKIATLVYLSVFILIHSIALLLSSPNPFPDLNWQYYAKQIPQADTISIPINPSVLQLKIFIDNRRKIIK